MVKYAKVKGYNTKGEIQMFSHLYQWVEDVRDNQLIILLHAYEESPTLFKGYLYNNTKQFKSVDVIEGELEDIESLVGKTKVIGFKEFITNTMLDSEFYQSFKAMEE